MAASPARADEDACVAASESAITLRAHGKLHDALKQLAACADPSCPDDVKAECARRILAVDGVMPSVVLAAKDEAGRDLTSLVVRVDGAPFATALDGVAVSVDPGEHTFRFERPGGAFVERTMLIAEGQRSVLVAASFAPAHTSPAPAAPEPRRPSPLRTAGWITAGAGAAGLVVGAIFGGVAVAKKSDGDCNASGGCTNLGAIGDAKTAANVSDVGLIGGAALAATGAVLLVLTSRAAPASKAGLRVVPAAGPGGGGLVLGGEF